MIADLQSLDALAELLDDAGTLVTADQWDGDVKSGCLIVQVGMAEAARDHPDQNLAPLGGIEIDLLGGPIATDLQQHGAFGLHLTLLRSLA